MSFAPPPNRNQQNNNNNNDINQSQTPSQQRQFINYESPQLNNSVRNDKQNMNQNNNNNNINQRLDLIEANLNRVCNQHDALMPLLNILEAMPQINKNEQEIKNLRNNQKQLEQKIKNLETQVSQNSNQHVFGTIERNFKQQNATIVNIKNKIKDIDENLKHNEKVIESKQKEEAKHIQRNVDSKLQENKINIQNILAEFKNSVQIEQKKYEEMSTNLRNPSMVQNSLNQNGDHVGGDDIHNDVQNLYREVGMMRSEIELLYDKERRNHIFAQLDQEIPLNDTNEKELVVANLEQSVFFEELERFDRENQERVIYELNCLEDKLNNMLGALHNPNSKGGVNQALNDEIKGEITYIEDRFFNIKQQIKGTKKKYLVDVRKLEDRLENLYRMREHINQNNQNQAQDTPQKQQADHLQKHMIIIDSYPARVDRINQNVVDNVETLQTRQKNIDEKLLNIHKDLLK